MSESQHRALVDELAQDIYATVFDMLDGVPEYSGNEAGRIATVVELAFRETMRFAGVDADAAIAR